MGTIQGSILKEENYILPLRVLGLTVVVRHPCSLQDFGGDKLVASTARDFHALIKRV